mgnify:CR=1 FL=1
MSWSEWIVFVLLILNAGWMLFDGCHALITGDYVTPSKGEYKGQLGPWTHCVEALGMKPRSTLMKVLFVVFGVVGVAVAIGFVLQCSWARDAACFVAICGLWYLPLGTVLNAVVLALLLSGGF